MLNQVYLERPVSHWLQLASTVLGALALGGHALRRWCSSPVLGGADPAPAGPGAVAGWLVVAIAGCIGAVGGVLEHSGGTTHHGLNYLLLTRAISAAALAALAVGGVWRVRAELTA